MSHSITGRPPGALNFDSEPAKRLDKLHAVGGFMTYREWNAAMMQLPPATRQKVTASLVEMGHITVIVELTNSGLEQLKRLGRVKDEPCR